MDTPFIVLIVILISVALAGIALSERPMGPDFRKYKH